MLIRRATATAARRALPSTQALRAVLRSATTKRRPCRHPRGGRLSDPGLPVPRLYIGLQSIEAELQSVRGLHRGVAAAASASRVLGLTAATVSSSTKTSLQLGSYRTSEKTPVNYCTTRLLGPMGRSDLFFSQSIAGCWVHLPDVFAFPTYDLNLTN